MGEIGLEMSAEDRESFEEYCEEIELELGFDTEIKLRVSRYDEKYWWFECLKYQGQEVYGGGLTRRLDKMALLALNEGLKTKPRWVGFNLNFDPMDLIEAI